MTNRELCDRYPFLIPSNRWSGKKITEAQDGGYWPGSPDEIPEYDYDYTELDSMPDGWRVAFGEQMCEEIRDALLNGGGEEALNEYRILQIKEKYGSLRWYDLNGNEDTLRIVDKYERRSETTCITCGEPATQVSLGWISPFCDDCANRLHEEGNVKFVPLLGLEE